MSSQINPNNIDGNYPVAGVDNNSQGFRDNFTNTKVNFQYAENEINDLQNKAVLKAALIGEVLDNDMADNLIYAAKIRDFSASRVAIGAGSGSITIDYAEGHYQTITTSGSVSLSFTNFPPTGAYGLMRIQFDITDVTHTLQLPAAVSLGLSGIQGISPGTSGVSNTITFGSTGVYEFAFGSSDNGSTITLFDLNRALVNFNTADIQTDDLTATGNVIAGGNVIGGQVRSTSTISAVGNVIAANLNSSSAVSAIGNVIGGNVIAGTQFSTTGWVNAGNVTAFLNATAGTTTVPSIKVSSGILLVTPQAGAVEMDSSVFYATPTAGSSSSQRGVWPAQHVIVAPSGGRVLTQNTSAQSVFDNPASGALTVTASTSYEIDGYYVISNTASPSTAHSISLSFGGTATVTSISYIADVTTSSGSPTAGATTISRNHSTAISALQITPAGTTTNTESVIVHLRGLVRVNDSGTFIPQIQYDTNAPGGASTVEENSWFRMSAIGNSTIISVGNWS